jgi:hypothetical protein
MSGNYQRWLIAKGNNLSPGPAAIVKLVDRLRKEKWIPESGGHAVCTVDKADAAKATVKLPAEITADWIAGAPEREEMRLVWTVEGDAAKDLEYPLSMKPEGKVAYSIEIHRAPEFVYPVADNIEMIDTTCNCDEDLAFDWDEDEVVPAFKSSVGIFAECEECSRTFDPAKELATITNAFDEDDDEDIQGGAAYRFALKVDCGKSFVEDAKLGFAKALVTLFEEEFGRSTYEVGAKY